MDASPLPTIVAPVNVHFNNHGMDNPPDYDVLDMMASAEENLPSYQEANDSLSPPPYNFDFDFDDEDVEVNERVSHFVPARLTRVPRTHNPFSRAYIPRHAHSADIAIAAAAAAAGVSIPSPRELEAGHAGHAHTTIVNNATVAVQVSAARVVGGRIIPGGKGKGSRTKGCKLCVVIVCLMVVGVVMGVLSLAAGVSGWKSAMDGSE